MKRAGDIGREVVQNSSRRTQSGSSARVARPGRAIHKLFARFTAWYGAAWTNRWSTDKMLEFGKVEWADALRDFPESAIDRGLDRARSECRMPPSPAEFRELCRRDPSHEVFRALPRPKDPGAEEKGRQALAEMRRMLRKEAG